MTALTTRAEEFADTARDLDAFSGFDLGHVKRKIVELMRHIGENGFFDQYTRHDVAHVDAMLKMLDWLIPSATREYMTSADWLLIVLSIYFHDLGMLITKAEYESRYETTFPAFRDSKLTTTDNDGKDYVERLKELADEDRDKFLYQEFVRANHATRIRFWIDAPNRSSLGSTDSLTNEIRDLLSRLDPVFRADLAKVCESHHEADLDDTAKYPVRRPYGNTSAEIANVQYAAIILRTADLLQITRDRTPSVAFRVFTPSDPLSQREWAKHMSVRAVLPQPTRDRDGNVDEEQQSSAIEVHARFTEESGFFGLTTYLSYASQELNKSYELAEASRKHGSKYTFPWRDIDQSHIETDGFLPSHYEFKLDQRRILDLLTGHTLYNDTNVVIRELAQNSIDAVRLTCAAENHNDGAKTRGKVTITWDPGTRVLEFRDNGTGMTQEIIENNFLRVGSSRYQDPRFRELHPNFNPISRFGIGVLSAFMIADSVEVITCHPDEVEVRQISLRSVHGRYLIRLLDKETDPVGRSLAPHGTLVRLRVRASAKIDDVIKVAREWFVLPQCTLEVEVVGKPLALIGYDELSEGLREDLISTGVLTSEAFDNGSVQIRTARRGAASLAYAVYWSKWYRTWELLSLDSARWIESNLRQTVTNRQTTQNPQLGICVEGVRVEFDSPGYEGLHLLAMANASGPSAPRTNVARSGLEDTPELKALIQDIYTIYCSHISHEIDELHEKRGRSATGASKEAAFLLSSLQAPRDSAYNPERATLRSAAALHDELRRVEVLLVEHDGRRVKSSLQDLAGLGEFYTIDDPFIETAESFLRYLPSDASLRQVLDTFSAERDVLPNGHLLVSRPTGVLSDMFFSSWQISKVDFSEQTLRVTSQWTPRSEHQNWFNERSAEPLVSFHDMYPLFNQFETSGIHSARIFNIPMRDIPFNGLDNSNYDGILTGNQIYLSPSHGYIADIGGVSKLQEFTDRGLAVFYYSLWRISFLLLSRRAQDRGYGREIYHVNVDFEDFISSRLASAFHQTSWIDSEDVALVLGLLPRRPLLIFDPHIVTKRAEM